MKFSDLKLREKTPSLSKQALKIIDKRGNCSEYSCDMCCLYRLDNSTCNAHIFSERLGYALDINLDERYRILKIEILKYFLNKFEYIQEEMET